MNNQNVEPDLYQLYHNVSLNLEDNICIYYKGYQKDIGHLDDD